MDEPIADLDEIRALMAHLPGPDLAAGSEASLHQAQLTKPPGALGRLEELAIWLATWQAQHPPRLDHPRTLVFAGNHGVAARGVSAYPAAVTAQMVQNFIAGGAAVNQLCRVFDAGLKVYEMNLDTPTADIVVESAMSEAECAKAMAYGMMAVEPGIDALALGEMGIGNTTAAAALCGGLFGGGAEMWTGPGTGVAGAAFETKRRVVGKAIARHRPAARDPFDMLRRLGGLELAAIAGAIMAARVGRSRRDFSAVPMITFQMPTGCPEYPFRCGLPNHLPRAGKRPWIAPGRWSARTCNAPRKRLRFPAGSRADCRLR